MICMDNVQIRQVISNLNQLINLCLPPGETQSAWKDCISSYREGVHILKSNIDFTNNQILSFHCEMNDFFHLLIELQGEEGITNYAHMPVSGHVMENLLSWQNLHCYSQQEWDGTSLIVYCINYTCTDVYLTFIFLFCIQ